jgi:hypothetical protein
MKIHLELCICINNPMVGTINNFLKVGCSIIDNFNKYQEKFLLFLIGPFENYFVLNISDKCNIYVLHM